MQHPLCECGLYVESWSSRVQHLKSGRSVNVTRCLNSVTGCSYAVKKIYVEHVKTHPWVLHDEVHALQAAAAFQVPRVGHLVSGFQSEDDICLVMEDTAGKELKQWSHSKRLGGSKPPSDLNEVAVKEVAVQLLETLHGLHNVAKYTHLNINTKNVMLRDDSASNWDRVRLLDFGLAQKCATDDGKYRLDVIPQACVPHFASPQTLQSSQLQFEIGGVRKSFPNNAQSNLASASRLRRQFPVDPHIHTSTAMQTAKARQAGKSRQTCLSCGQMPEVADIDVRGSAEEGDNMLYIDGCAADVFSAGVVLYELLTGELPFVPTSSWRKPKAPECVLPQGKQTWASLEATLQHHINYAKAVAKQCAAGHPPYQLKHPVLDKVRACSSTPDHAAAFFAAVLWPWAETRSGASVVLQSSYLRQTLNEMLEDQKKAGMQAGMQSEQSQALAFSSRTVPEGIILDLHSEPLLNQLCPQPDGNSPPLHQPEAKAASTAELGPCCPHGNDNCPAMHIQFLPAPTCLNSASPSAPAQLASKAATDAWIARQLCSIAVSDSPAAQPSAHITGQPPTAFAAAVATAEAAQQLPVKHCSEESSDSALPCAQTGLQLVVQSEPTTIMALPSAQVKLRAPAAQPETESAMLLPSKKDMAQSLHTQQAQSLELAEQPVLAPGQAQAGNLGR